MGDGTFKKGKVSLFKDQFKVGFVATFVVTSTSIYRFKTTGCPRKNVPLGVVYPSKGTFFLGYPADSSLDIQDCRTNQNLRWSSMKMPQPHFKASLSKERF